MPAVALEHLAALAAEELALSLGMAAAVALKVETAGPAAREAVVAVDRLVGMVALESLALAGLTESSFLERRYRFILQNQEKALR